MLNKNKLLENKKVVSKFLDIAFIYKGAISDELREEVKELLKEEKFISDKVKRIRISLYKRSYGGNLKDGFDISITEYYDSRSSRNEFYITREIIKEWLGYEVE